MKIIGRLAFLVILAIALPSLAAAGPVFAPGTRLSVIKTARFDIIFPERSKESALLLSTYADAVYDEVAGKLETGLHGRIPVTITPDIGTFNGYTSAFPYLHIVLFDTSLDIGWTAFSDNLRGLFLHELTHGVSFGIKPPWASFLSGIFGSWVMPVLLNSPMFMVEGVTVSFESADGVTGRANDPLIRQRVRQDIRENRFKTPIEASGLYDEYPGGDIFYEYGGLFSAYIQKAYGQGRYAELWKAMGELILPTSLDPYEVGFYKAFRKTYGIPFPKAWADFRDSLALSGLVDPPEVLEGPAPGWLFGGLAGNAGSLYWVDLRGARAMTMDLATGKRSALFDANYADAISDASPEAGAGAGRILVTRALALPDGRDRVESIVYDLGRRRFDQASSVPGMRDARFFRGGRIGIVSRLHNTDLAYASPEGTEVLLRGSESVQYSSPAVLDEGRVALIVAIGGKRRLGILEVDSRELSLVRTSGADAELFTYVRQLSASRDGTSRRIYFNYDSDDRFYKLGALDLGGEIRLETTDFSGGVLWPREAGGRVYYVGRFSEGESICRYPTAADSIGARSLAFDLEPFDPEGPRGAAREAVSAAAAAARIEPYRPLAYANPFNMWFVYPDLPKITRSFRIFSLFAFQDPIDTNTVNLSAGYDTKYPFADATLTWVSRELPAAITAVLGDNLLYGGSGPPERQTSATVSASLALPLYPSQRAVVLGLGGGAFAKGTGDGGSPYGWGYSGLKAIASADLGLDGTVRGALARRARGFSLMTYHDLEAASLAYKAEARFVAATDAPGLRLELWGAWGTGSFLQLDSKSSVFAADRRPEYYEYSDTRIGASSLLAEGSVSCALVDQPIHSNFLGLYFNRLIVDAGCRGAWFRDEPLGSAFARLSLDVMGAAGMASAGLRVFAEGFARLSETDVGRIFGWRLGIDLGGDGGAWLR